MNFNELYYKTEESLKEHNYGSCLGFLHVAARQILRDEKILVSTSDIEYFLNYVTSVQVEGENYCRGALWTRNIDDIATEINRICLQIIRKYDIQDLKIKLNYLRVVINRKEESEEKRKLNKELDDLIKMDVDLEMAKKRLK